MPKPDRTPPAEIERIEAPTREVLVENYIKRRRPVILTGVATQMKAYQEWTPDYLREVAGDSVVTAHYDENADFQQWYDMNDGEREDRQLPLGQLLDPLLADPPDLRYYMTEHALHLISEDLLADISLNQYISDELEPDETRGRGHRGTGRPREMSLWLESSSSSVTPKESSTSGSSTDPEDLLTSAAKYAARSSSEQTSDSDTDAVDGDTDSLSQLSES